MVFRIRDKNVFWTRNGWRNNYNPKCLNMPRTNSTTDTQYVSSRKDHHSYLRMVQSYRNYSRICKQYFYGDKKLEHALQMELRAAFHLPFTCVTPVELVKLGAERRMADQLDRDYQLLSYNYHPFQLYAYKLQNQRLRRENEQAELNEKGLKSNAQHLEDAFEAELANQRANLPVGESLSLQKMAQVYTRVLKVSREHTGEVNETRGSDGEYNDYLERRRPLTEANDRAHSQ